MSEIKEIKAEILMSLYFKSATINELMSREFLKNKNQFMIEKFLQFLENNNYVYFKNNKYCSYKNKHVKIFLNKYGYDVS